MALMAVDVEEGRKERERGHESGESRWKRANQKRKLTVHVTSKNVDPLFFILALFS